MNPKYLIKYEDLKVGQKVWTIQCGDCEIISLTNTGKYPILAGIKDREVTYTETGTYNDLDEISSLFLSNPFEDQVSEERVVLVSHDNIEWRKRVLYLIKNNKFICWNNAETIEEAKKIQSLTDWGYMKEIEIELQKELTIE